MDSERRQFQPEDHERLIKIEIQQQNLNKQFSDHEVHDVARFQSINDLLTTMKAKQEMLTETQIKLTTTLWLVGCFIIVLVPVITTLAVTLLK